MLTVCDGPSELKTNSEPSDVVSDINGHRVITYLLINHMWNFTKHCVHKFSICNLRLAYPFER